MAVFRFAQPATNYSGVYQHDPLGFVTYFVPQSGDLTDSFASRFVATQQRGGLRGRLLDPRPERLVPALRGRLARRAQRGRFGHVRGARLPHRTVRHAVCDQRWTTVLRGRAADDPGCRWHGVSQGRPGEADRRVQQRRRGGRGRELLQRRRRGLDRHRDLAVVGELETSASRPIPAERPGPTPLSPAATRGGTERR